MDDTIKTQVIFQPVPTKPRWWYVVQVAPRSKQIYEEHDLVENVVNADLASTSTPSQTQSDIVTTIEEMESNIAEPNVELQMENKEIERQNDEELPDANEERQTSDEELANANEDMEDEILMNNDQLSSELELFIDIFAQQDLIDDENDPSLAN